LKKLRLRFVFVIQNCDFCFISINRAALVNPTKGTIQGIVET